MDGEIADTYVPCCCAAEYSSSTQLSKSCMKSLSSGECRDVTKSTYANRFSPTFRTLLSINKFWLGNIQTQAIGTCRVIYRNSSSYPFICDPIPGGFASPVLCTPA